MVITGEGGGRGRRLSLLSSRHSGEDGWTADQQGSGELVDAMADTPLSSSAGLWSEGEASRREESRGEAGVRGPERGEAVAAAADAASNCRARSCSRCNPAPLCRPSLAQPTAAQLSCPSVTLKPCTASPAHSSPTPRSDAVHM